METKPTYSNLINFEKWLSREIKAQEITILKLAKISGVHPNTIHNYLSGRSEPSFYNVLCIVRALGYEVGAIPR